MKTYNATISHLEYLHFDTVWPFYVKREEGEWVRILGGQKRPINVSQAAIANMIHHFSFPFYTALLCIHCKEGNRVEGKQGRGINCPRYPWTGDNELVIVTITKYQNRYIFSDLTLFTSTMNAEMHGDGRVVASLMFVKKGAIAVACMIFWNAAITPQWAWSMGASHRTGIKITTPHF